MRTIVLVTRENDKKVTHVLVYLCNNCEEALGFCRFIRHLRLDDGSNFEARQIKMNRDYSLEKYQPLTFDDIATLPDRTIQKLMRELDSEILAVALKEANDEVQDCFFRNMSKRAAAMIKEDMDYMGPVDKTDIESARQLILETYHFASSDAVFNVLTSAYRVSKKTDKNQPVVDEERDHIVLVFRGTGNISECLSVSLFDTYQAADNFCNFLNDLKSEKDTFIYAKHAEQVVEYEITKPQFVRFDQIFEFLKFQENAGSMLIRDALKRFSPDTLFEALIGMDKKSRELIMRGLPVKTTDKINEIMKSTDKPHGYFPVSRQSKDAQTKILNAINKNLDKYTKGNGKLGNFVEVLKD